MSGETGHLVSLKSVTLRSCGLEKQYDIEETLPLDAAASVLMKFIGIDSPEQAKTLTGAELVSGRAGAAPLRADEYYIEDLKGLAVIAAAPEPAADTDLPGGEILGTISDVLEGGGGNLAEVLLGSGEKVLVPFRNEFFGEIDLERRRAVLLARWILEE